MPVPQLASPPLCLIYLKFRALLSLIQALLSLCFPSSHSLSHVHPCSLFRVYIYKKKMTNSSNPFLASHCLGVNQGEYFLTSLQSCEGGQMCSCGRKGFIHGYLWPRGLGSSPSCLAQIQFRPLPCCVSFSKMLNVFRASVS